MEKREPSCTVGGNVDTTTMENSKEVLRKLYIELPYDPAIPPLGIHADKNFSKKDTCICMFIEVPFTIANARKQYKCPSRDEWIRNRCCIYTIEYYSAIKCTK